jgi:predicted SprT family Zn-dependent metalloprotease
VNLEAYFSQINTQYFRAQLPLPTLRWNSRLRTTAGRFCPGSHNPFRPKISVIEVADYLRQHKEGEKHVRDTILHEMIHYWLWWNKKPYGHTAEFHRIMRATGAQRFNPVPMEKPVKYWYQCPSCNIRVPARRKLGLVACLPCCKKFNRGQFSQKFILQILDSRLQPAPSPYKFLQEEERHLSYGEVIERLENLKELVMKARIGTRS